MIDIRKSQIIIYDNGRREATVYGDSDEANKYYLVPEPRLVHDADGTPHFSLTRYEINEGAAGICVFDVELAIADEARRAAEAQLGPDILWGQLDWIQAAAYFHFDVEGESRLLRASPSLYGNNRATVRVELANDAEVDSFVNAFHAAEGSVSSFSIEYDVTTLTMLQSANASLAYNADIAIAYETQYEKYKNTWGQTKNRAVGVKQLLRESGAGDVDVTFGEGVGDETRQRVLDWAWTTLERLVDNALQTALQMSGGKNPVHYMGSFKRTYNERDVVEWTITSANPLPRFTDEVWNRVYTKVDRRELVVNFALLGELTQARTEQALISDVLVTVDYPTRKTNNTFKLEPTSDSTYAYRAPGSFEDGEFVDEFRYRYKVVYAQGGEVFESDWIASNETEIDILPAQLGLRQVTFLGSNIPFKSGRTMDVPASHLVEKLVIDFFFTRPGGQPNKVQSKVMTADNQTTGVLFDGFFHLPLTNEYSYRLIYQMVDGATVVVEPTERFGSQNRDVVMLLNPLLTQTFSLLVLNPSTNPSNDGDERITNVFLSTQYVDPVNRNTGKSNVFQWQSGGTPSQPTPWTFLAVPNPGGAYFEMDGQITYGQSSVPINRLLRQAQTAFLFLEPGFEPYSVEIDGSQIDWESVTQVLVTLLQTAPTQPPLALRSQMSDLAARARFDRRALAIEGTTTNIVSYSLLKPDSGRPDENPRRHYLVRRKRGDANIVYWYSTQYVMADGSIKSSEETSVTDRLKIMLPRTPNTETPLFNLRQDEV